MPVSRVLAPMVFLSEGDLITVYGRLGAILHAENPMGKETDYGSLTREASRWVSEIVSLLECHKVHLYHRPQEFYLIKMFGDMDGELVLHTLQDNGRGPN